MDNMSREIELQKAICDYLKAHRFFFWRQNNLGVWDNIRKSYRKNPRQTKGIPDIFVLLRGNLYGLEIKTETNRQTLDQLEFQKDFERNGGHYFLVRSLSQVMSLFY